ncbi:fucolectin-like [Littorina saxatilis]|uniref:fucolectin-like n=1 Tax=Littorina saxatilis TaxID=31220 RepID=UPI0038B43E86
MHWWQVDLAATFSVFSVTITNRGDCCGELKNVALHKSTTQSANSNGNNGFGGAELAVDGNSNPDYFVGGTCTHTAGQGHWWQVDLASTFSVFSVTITNRGDCCGERLHDFDVHVYGEEPVTNQVASGTLCHHYNGPMGAGVTEDLPCYNAPISGRFVRVTNSVTNGDDPLTLCEVQVMAVPFIE